MHKNLHCFAIFLSNNLFLHVWNDYLQAIQWANEESQFKWVICVWFYPWCYHLGDLMPFLLFIVWSWTLINEQSRLRLLSLIVSLLLSGGWLFVEGWLSCIPWWIICWSILFTLCYPACIDANFRLLSLFSGCMVSLSCLKYFFNVQIRSINWNLWYELHCGARRPRLLNKSQSNTAS